MLLVRSYRTFAPLPYISYQLSVIKYFLFTVNYSLFTEKGRYISVALSSRSLALGVTQQVWSFGSPDFPQTPKSLQPPTLTLSHLQFNHYSAPEKTYINYFEGILYPK